MILTDKQIADIKQRAITFTRNTLGEGESNQMCFTISYPLSIHMCNSGIANSIRRGRIGCVDHYWLELNYENGSIIDPTARQFNKELGYVHFGEELTKPEDYDMEQVVKLWSAPLKNNEFDIDPSISLLEMIPKELLVTPLPPQNNSQRPPIETYIHMGLKAAIILIMDNNFDSNNRKYIDVIRDAAKKFYGNDLINLPAFDNINIFCGYCM
jgi:hypothetical protein